MKKLLKIIKIAVLTMIMISLVVSNMLSHDEHHLETCEVEDCTTCHMIMLAQAIVKVMTFVIIVSTLTFVIYFVLSRMHKVLKVDIEKSLVFQKVQFNN